MTDPSLRPAYYAAGAGPRRDWWTLLHPPYTLWHLSYVVIGACLAPRLDPGLLGLTVAAFLAAMGVSAHALDELKGRPLGTAIPSGALTAAAAAGLTAALVLGLEGVRRAGPGLIPFMAAGVFFVLAYNLEWFGGRFHTDVGFAAAWGAFPVLTAYFAQAQSVDLTAALAALGAFGLSRAQRILSTPARRLRRKVTKLEATATLTDGTVEEVTAQGLLAPLEAALKALSYSVVAVALALLAARTL